MGQVAIEAVHFYRDLFRRVCVGEFVIMAFSLGSTVSRKIVGMQGPPDDRAFSPFRQAVIQRDLKKADGDVEGRPPEDLLPAGCVTVDKARQLIGPVLVRFGLLRRIDRETADKIFPIKGGQRDFPDLFDLAVRAENSGAFHIARKRKNRPAEEGKAVSGEGTKEPDSPGGKPDLLPGFPQGVGQKKGDDPEGLMVPVEHMSARRSAKDRKGTVDRQKPENTVPKGVENTPGTAQVSRLRDMGRALDKLKIKLSPG